MGLVNRVVPAEELESYVNNYCAMIAANAPLTVRAAKVAIREALKDESARDLALVQAPRRRMLCQRRLRRRPHRLHGKAQAGVQRAVNPR